ncbi:MAG TPA: transglutaminase-like domain-containing protein, partial [Anaerolineae bacterium]|nr:transglutaminase-like domain-containing protein [Anaerolineae bacterium]
MQETPHPYLPKDGRLAGITSGAVDGLSVSSVFSPNRYAQAMSLTKGRSWSMLLLLLIVFASAVAGIVDVLWGLEFAFLFSVAFVALLLQWWLATIPISPRLAAALSAILGVDYIAIRAGRLENQIWLCWREVFVLLGAWLSWLWRTLGALLVWLGQWEWREKVGLVWEGAPQWLALPDGRAMVESWLFLWQQIGNLWTHAYQWLQVVLGGGPPFDALGATLVWAVVLWLLASWAAWVTRRHYQSLLGILPISVTLLFVISYTRAFPSSLLPLLLCCFVLLALGNHRAREARWESLGLDFARDLWGKLFLIVLPIALALVLLGLIVPASDTNPIAEWLDELVYGKQDQTVMDTLADSLGMEQKPPPPELVPAEDIPTPGLPSGHSVQAGAELPNRIVLYMATSDILPMRGEDMMDFAPPDYRWRSYTYDTYTGRGWVTTGTQELSYTLGTAIVPTDTLVHQRLVRQSATRIADRGNIVHVAGTLVAVDQDYTVAWRSNGDFFGATVNAKTYHADVLLPVFTELALREITAPYPDWVLERYLQLPDTVPPRVIELAQTLTADIPITYDKAIALESYMRTYSYTLEVPAPPPGREVADYFLFDLQEGYCDYFATTMVVLARASGLPARVVMGYIGGAFDPGLARFTVRERDAHAWVEIYFPEYGWIEFEPTSGRPAIVRVAGYSESGEPGQLPPTPLPPSPLTAQPPGPSRELLFLWDLLRLLALGVGLPLMVLLLATVADALFLLLRYDARTLSTRLYH